MLLVPTLHALYSFLAAASPAITAAEPQWGGFRGANGSGTSAGAVLPAKLDAAENLLWQVALPKGYSSPVVAGDRVFTTGHEGKKLFTLGFDAATGKELWRAEVEFEGKRPGGNSFAAPTPATDGERVFALFHHVGMVAYDLAGKELWRNPLGAPFNIPHGLATSPIVHGDSLLLQLDQDGASALVCLHPATGKEKWRTVRDDATHSYATPAIYTPKAGAPQVIVSGSYQITSYALATGEKLWWLTGAAWQSKAVPLFFEDLCIVSSYMPPSSEYGVPNVGQTYAEALAEKDKDADGQIGIGEWDHDMMKRTWFIWDLNGDERLDEREYVYLQSAQTAKGGLFAIDLEVEGKPLTGDVTKTHLAWQFDGRRGLSDVVSPVLVGGTLFLLKDGLLTAMDARTGTVGKQERLGEADQYFGSPVCAEGRVLAASLSGQLSVFSGVAEWEVLSTTAVEGQVWSTPALADGRIYVRAEAQLYCFGEKGA